MTRGCVVETCQKTPAKKAICCGQRLCAEHAESCAAHACPAQRQLLETASDPKKLKAWRAANAPEEAQYTAICDALNRMAEIEIAWQSRKKGGVRANDAARAVGDFTAIARGDGRHVEVEMKGSHKDDCACDSCAAQRDRAERIRGAGGVYVGPVRTLREVLDGVRMGLARVRGRSAA